MLRGKQRHSKQKGMVASKSNVDACPQCRSLVASAQIYEGWCFSCVLRWGHEDDAIAVRCISRDWQGEAVSAALIESQRYKAEPITMAIQVVGEADHFDKSNASAHINVERATAVAGDGFLYDDSHTTGKWSDEARPHFIAALTKLFEGGFPIRAISRATGISRNTIRYYREKLRLSIRSCACGQPATHQGWCRERFMASRLRQQFMKTWHPEREWLFINRDLMKIAWTPTDGAE